MWKRNGGRRFSYALYQGGMESPADSRFTSSNHKLLEQMQEKMAVAVKTYEALRQEREGKKKDNKQRNNKFPLILCVLGEYFLLFLVRYYSQGKVII